MKQSHADTFLDDVVSAWLRRESNVEKYGIPCWRTLAKALTHKRLLMNGLAHQIAKEKGFAFEGISSRIAVAWCPLSVHEHTSLIIIVVSFSYNGNVTLYTVLLYSPHSLLVNPLKFNIDCTIPMPLAVRYL